MDETIEITLSPKDAGLLRELARRDDCSESELVAEALHFYLDNL